MATVSQHKGVIPFKRKYGFLTCEPIAALVLLFGTIATFLTQKMIFAAAPLAFLVLINLHNRRQLDSLSRQFVLRRLANIQRLLQTDLQAIQRHLPAVNNNSHRAELVQHYPIIMALSDRLMALEAKGSILTMNSAQLQSLETTITELGDQVLHCRQALTTLDQGLQDTSVLQHSTIIHRLADVKAALHHGKSPNRFHPQLSDRVYSQLLSPILADLASLQKRILSIAIQVEQEIQPKLDNPMALQVVQLQLQVSNLNQQMEDKQAEWSAQARRYQNTTQVLQVSLKHMQAQLSSLSSKALNSNQRDLSSLVLSHEVSHHFQSMLAPLYIQIVNLDNHLDHRNFEAQVTQHQFRHLQVLKRHLLDINHKVLLIEKKMNGDPIKGGHIQWIKETE